MLKAAIKHASGEDQVRHRTLPTEVVSKWAKKLDSMKNEIAAVLREEKEEKQVKNFARAPELNTDAHAVAAAS